MSDTFKFIHAGDIHLDSPLVGLQRYEGAPVERIRGATRAAFDNLVRTAVDEKAAFLLLAGDLFDGDWRDYNTGLYFRARMGELREAGVRVFVIAGNHDAANQMTRSLRMPENVRVFSDRAPERHILEKYGVAVHGQGFPTRAVVNDLSHSYPSSVSGLFNIGLLHTSLDGREGHDPYAPCSLDQLRSKNYDYWALGHVHKREVICEDPWVVFCGNSQGRHANETGAKGCSVVTVSNGKVSSVDHRGLDVLRWSRRTVNVAGASGGYDVIDRVRQKLREAIDQSDGRLLAVRLKLVGSCVAHDDLCGNPEKWINEVRAIATDLSNGEIWVERVDFQTRPEASADALLVRDDAIGGLLRAIRDLDVESQSAADVLSGLGDLYNRLPGELKEGENAIDFQSPEAIRKVLEDARYLLYLRLFARGDEL